MHADFTVNIPINFKTPKLLATKVDFHLNLLLALICTIAEPLNMLTPLYTKEGCHLIKLIRLSLYLYLFLSLKRLGFGSHKARV
jgi:hypothetical protein